MKKFILTISALCLSISAYADTVNLSKEQFENLENIDLAMRKKYPQYKGVNGSSDKLEVFGISSESFYKEMAKVKNIDEIKSEEETARLAAIDKLKTAAGLTDAEIEILGLEGR